MTLGSIWTFGCYGIAILFLIIVVAGVTHKKKPMTRGTRRSHKDLKASDKQNQRTIDQAYRRFERLTADEIRELSKQLGPNLIGEPPSEERAILKQLVSAKRICTRTTVRQLISIREKLDLDEEFLRALDARLVHRIEAMLAERWNKLQTRAEKKLTDKVCEVWCTFAGELDGLCQDLWSNYGPVPELLSSWSEKVEARANELEEQLPE